jgi:formate hydrogenlyase subunit 3/multisubunit Na+/H+ antiporter MnhD subunit
MGISLGTLAGLPPSPLFLSEVLIVAGGFQAGRVWVAAVATVLLALGFLGLGHALLETTAGKARRRDDTRLPGLRMLTVFTTVSVFLLAILASAALWLPGTSLIDSLAKGIS